MRVAERGPKRMGAGVAWTLLALVLVPGWLFVAYFGGVLSAIAIVALLLTLFICGTKAYAAFTGVRRFGAPPVQQPPSA